MEERFKAGKTDGSAVEAFQTCASRTGAPRLVIVKGLMRVILSQVDPSVSGSFSEYQWKKTDYFCVLKYW